MNKLRQEKGILLITVYLVVLILMGLSGAFFYRTIHAKKMVESADNFLKALYNAEKGLSYAYYEISNQGYSWFTHEIDALGNIVPKSATPVSLRTQGSNADAAFITEGDDLGCYRALDGSFILKSFPDSRLSDTTVVRIKGISGNNQRVIEYRLSRTGIYDYAWWTNYNLSIKGDYYANGGRIHANGNISLYSSAKIYDVDSIKTGKDNGIYYAESSKYIRPGYYDYYVDNSGNVNGELPLPDLGRMASNSSARAWAGTNSSQNTSIQAPWINQTTNSYYSNPASDFVGSWPPAWMLNAEWRFYGDSQPQNYVWNNEAGKNLNGQNTWIYPALKDTDGEVLFYPNGTVMRDTARINEIPAELDGNWSWTKYDGNGTVQGADQKEIRFTVYNGTGGKKYMEDTRWAIINSSAVMVNSSYPGAKTYVEMLQNVTYWNNLGYNTTQATIYANNINPEILDGTYGSENLTIPTNITVNKTNSLKQSEGWNNWLQQKNLGNVFLTNEIGETMEPPRFATTYKGKSKEAGLYLSRKGGSQTLHYANSTAVTYTAHNSTTYTNTTTYDNWLLDMGQAVDVLVDRLNKDAAGNLLDSDKRCAKKVSFINFYTNKTETVLELDLDKMQEAGTYPANGIIYAEVPVRITQANELPHSGAANNATFHLIGEENVYLKGNYNNPTSQNDWMASAVVSKKQIHTLSDDFNDPQVSPAFPTYPNYPYIYVTKDGSGNLQEANPYSGGGFWASPDSYVKNSQDYTKAVQIRDAIENKWEATFDKDDESGQRTYTVSGSSHPIIDGQTWGAMPNEVEYNQVYNCLMASYYNGYADIESGTVDMASASAGIPSGVNLERWENKNKTLQGSFFQLDWADETDPDRFTAHSSDGPVDYINSSMFGAPFDIRSGSRPPSGANYYSISDFLALKNINVKKSYDTRYRSKELTRNKGFFFGGGEFSWREISVDSF